MRCCSRGIKIKLGVGSITLSDFQLYYKGIINKKSGWGFTVGVRWTGQGRKTGKNWENCNRTTINIYRKIDKWNRIQSPGINPWLYGQLSYDKKAKNIQWGESRLFNKWFWENWQPHKTEWNWTTILYHKQKLIQYGLNIWM